MQYYSPVKNPHFIGREPYWQRLSEIEALEEAAVIVVYGRRRVGKTELIEQFFLGRPILKFEGLQPDLPMVRRGDPAERQRQIDECLSRLGRYLGRPAEYRKMNIRRWGDFFELLAPVLQKQPVILYLEELQWMANYSSELLSEFKPWWDDMLRHNPRLRVVISGSSPSFIVGQFLGSSAMYNRSNHMMKLEPFSLGEIKDFLGKGQQEALLAAIAVGGIPEYLKQVEHTPSVYIGLCEKSFRPGGFFRVEKERVFVSSLSANRFYEGIIDYLARHKSATRNEIYQALTKGDSGTPGGSFSLVLKELVELNFVERQIPITARMNKRSSESTRQARYAIADEYLHFYYCFIDRRKNDIDAGKYLKNPVAAINRQDFSKLMGLSFERWCRKNEYLIARHLGFGGIVDYNHGPWYEKDAAQIDLMYIRKDSKLILCEIKYNNESPLNRQVIHDVQEKVDIFLKRNPKYARYTVETALITTEPAPESIRLESFFTYLVTGEDLIRKARGE